jgi:hypothetical protein
MRYTVYISVILAAMLAVKTATRHPPPVATDKTNDTMNVPKLGATVDVKALAPTGTREPDQVDLTSNERRGASVHTFRAR